jgi:beta-glucosidase
MTVLTNNGTLPLAEQHSIALIGVPARETLLMGGGSAEVTPPHQVSILDGLLAADGVTVNYAGGVEVGSPPPARPGFTVDPVDGRPGLRLRITDADGATIVDEHLDDTRRVLGWRCELDRPGACARLTAQITHDGPLQLGVIGIGNWSTTTGGRREDLPVDPVTGIPGESLLAPPQRLLTSRSSGPVPLDARVDLGDQVHAMIGLIARPAPLPDQEAIGAAVAAARAAEVAVVVVGLTSEHETESGDKYTLALPGNQDALVEAVAAAARRTVVVVNAATPVLMPWADRVDAILVAGLPGQEGGHAVAAALLGHREPTGRLVTSWPTADGASTAWSVTPEDGAFTSSCTRSSVTTRPRRSAGSRARSSSSWPSSASASASPRHAARPDPRADQSAGHGSDLRDLGACDLRPGDLVTLLGPPTAMPFWPSVPPPPDRGGRYVPVRSPRPRPGPG